MNINSRKRHLRPSVADLRGWAQLATQATRGVTAIVEGVHQSVWRTLGAPAGEHDGRTRGLTGSVYRGIDGITRKVGGGVDGFLARLQERFDSDDQDSPHGIAMRSIMNGVMGDHLVASANPLALPMSLRRAGIEVTAQRARTLHDPRRHIVLSIHGLCMNDLQWRGDHRGDEVDHAATVAAALGATALSLRYNTGLHVSENGRSLSELLAQLVAFWPVPIEQITFVTHSMGGLVARSACHHGEDTGQLWRTRLRHLVFLGTPHHGAPLERGGQWLDRLLGQSLFSAPFAALGQMRSAGITDLRHGNVRDADWQGRDRFTSAHDHREHLPLPDDVACFSVAATLAARRGPLAERLIGDGLVPLHSALGQHDVADRDLGLHRHAHWISHGTGHIELLYRPEVGTQIVNWCLKLRD
ncbi:MAG TPA: alpha/beta hydrolase [Pseudomonadota bacterium]|nr:hypothetical protein [Xanthomonadales bacterium]HQW81887.1 alpha/beta hydrolase [Pseudomonadota bacterium]